MSNAFGVPCGMAVEHGWDAILRELIGFPTVSSESNLPLIEYAERYLAAQGFATERRYNREGNKANLLARIGPEANGGIALAGHTDVVPVSGQDWHSDPFEMTERDGYLHGRGTADMKGFIALAMHAAAHIDAAALRKPLHLLLTYDEETGCQGAMALQDELRSMDARPAFVLIGEPTAMQLVTAHKGIQQMITTVQGKPGHSSRPDVGASAIRFAADFISGLESVLPTGRDDTFNPPVTTSNIGVIRGGEAVNIIPEHCEFRWEFRPLPGQDPSRIHASLSEMVEALKARMPGVAVHTRLEAAVPAMLAGDNEQVVLALAQHLEPEEPRTSTAPFVTEGGLYQEAGLPAVICGPGRLEQAHQPDECVSRQAMDRYASFLATLLTDRLT